MDIGQNWLPQSLDGPILKSLASQSDRGPPRLATKITEQILGFPRWKWTRVVICFHDVESLVENR